MNSAGEIIVDLLDGKGNPPRSYEDLCIYLRPLFAASVEEHMLTHKRAKRWRDACLEGLHLLKMAARE